MGVGDEAVEVPQPLLVLGQHDEVLGLPPGLALAPESDHGRVDGLEGMDPHVVQHLEKGNEHIGHRGGIVAGPVVVEGGQVEPRGHDVQLVFSQIGQQVLGQDERVQRGVGKGSPHPAAALGDEAHVELGVVGGQGPSCGKGQEGVDGLGLPGGPLQHLVGDAGELHDLVGELPPGADEGVEGLAHLPVPEDHRADLDDEVVPLAQAGGLNVEADDLSVEVLLGWAVHHHPVVHVVDEVGLHAVEDFDLLGRVPGVREGLGHPVVGDGHRPVPPLLRPLHRRSGGGEGVHAGHGGMEMELHPLFGRGVLPLLPLPFHDGIGLQHHVVCKTVQVEPALDENVHPLVDTVHQGLPLVPGEKLADPYRTGIVGDVEADHPGLPPGQLLVLH